MYTIITTTDRFDVDGTRWARGPDGDLYVYDAPGDAADPVAEVAADNFVSIFERTDTDRDTHTDTTSP